MRALTQPTSFGFHATSCSVCAKSMVSWSPLIPSQSALGTGTARAPTQSTRTEGLYVCMYVCMHVCMVVYICIYVCMYACLYVCLHVMYVCMYVCMHVCIYIYVWIGNIR